MEKGLEVLQMSVTITPDETTGTIATTKSGLEFLNIIYGISHDEVKKLVSQHIEKPFLDFTKSLTELQKSKKKEKIENSTPGQLEKELMQAFDRLFKTVIGGGKQNG